MKEMIEPLLPEPSSSSERDYSAEQLAEVKEEEEVKAAEPLQNDHGIVEIVEIAKIAKIAKIAEIVEKDETEESNNEDSQEEEEHDKPVVKDSPDDVETYTNQARKPSFVDLLPLTISSIQFLQSSGILQTLKTQKEGEDRKIKLLARGDSLTDTALVNALWQSSSSKDIQAVAAART